MRTNSNISQALGKSPELWTSAKGNLIGYRAEVREVGKPYARVAKPKEEWRWDPGVGLQRIKQPGANVIPLFETISYRDRRETKLHVYSIWPLRHYFINAEVDQVLGRKFDLNLELVFKIARYWTPKRTKKWIEQRKAGGRWLPKWAETGVHPCRALINTLPPRVRNIAHKLSTSDCQKFLYLARIDQEVVALYEQNPYLALRLARLLPYGKADTYMEKNILRDAFGTLAAKTALKRALRMPRNELLTLLVSSPTFTFELLPRSLVKRLGKIRIQDAPSAVGSAGCNPLFRVMNTKLMKHLPFITYPLIKSLIEEMHTMTEQALFNIIPMRVWQELNAAARKRKKCGSHTNALTDGTMLIRDTIRLEKDFQKLGVVPDAPAITNLKSVLARHDALAAHHRLVRDEVLNFPFNVPVPFKGNDAITPLVSPAALIKEAGTMHHCVGSYDSLVHEGKSYIYHVETEEEKATLEITRDYDYETDLPLDSWSIQQFRGPCNRGPSRDLWNLVNEWAESVGVNLQCRASDDLQQDVAWPEEW